MFRSYLFSALVALSLSVSVSAEELVLPPAGLNVSANLVTAGDNWTDGPVILMTHGTLAHNRMEIMETLQEVFLDRGYSSLAINLSLGLSDRHGMYDCNVPHAHHHTDALDEIALWLNWLKEKGVNEVVLLGHSRGGNQTAWFAVERDDPVIQSVILVAPATWDEVYASESYQKRYGQSLQPLLERARELVAAGEGDTMMSVDFIYCEDTQATASAFVSYYQPDPRHDTPYLIPSIDKPVLIFAGSADKVVKGLIEKVEPLAESDSVDLEVIADADHFFRDLFAEDLADIAVEFIEAH